MSRDWTDIEDVDARVNLLDLVGKYVALKKKGLEYWGLCPFHGEKTASFSVVVHKGDPFFYCHGCGATGRATTFMRKYHGIDYREAVSLLGGDDLIKRADEDKAKRAAMVRAREKTEAEENEKKRRNAFAAWSEALPAGGTAVEGYLRARGIQGEVPSSLRYHPRLFCHEVREELPAMLGAIVDVRGTFLALHRTWLKRGTDHIWRKAPLQAPKKVAARYAGGAIRLYPSRYPDAPAGMTLYIGEGIETSLSIVEGLRLRPDLLASAMVWAGVSLTNMSRVVLPMAEGGAAQPIARVVLCMDADMRDPKAAETAALHAKMKWSERGIDVRAVYPPTGMDLNDVIQKGAAA